MHQLGKSKAKNLRRREKAEIASRDTLNGILRNKINQFRLSYVTFVLIRRRRADMPCLSSEIPSFPALCHPSEIRINAVVSDLVLGI